VGDIAPAAARDANLGEDAGGFLENDDAGAGIGLGGGKGGEESGRAAACNDDVAGGGFYFRRSRM
jgi:hypothetical protein